MAYQYTNSKGTIYYLHRKEITLRGSGRTQLIYFFSKQPTDDTVDELPEGYIVVENKRTGLPVLKKT